MSSSGKYNQFHKIYGITKLRSDIILMSDTRLCNRNLVSAEDDIKKLFLNNPYGQYNAWFNSTQNKRGVGILIKKKISVSVLRVMADRTENYLLQELMMSGERLIIGSIYGPNNLDRQFFVNLENDLIELNAKYIIL
jgi:exonuclease III